MLNRLNESLRSDSIIKDQIKATGVNLHLKQQGFDFVSFNSVTIKLH